MTVQVTIYTEKQHPMKLKTLLTLTLSTALAGFSSAATIVQTQTFDFVPNGSAPLLFNKFNTALGTLTGVTVSVLMNKNGGRFEVDNDSLTGGTLTLTHTVTGSLSSSVSLVKTGGASSVGQSGSVTAVSTLASVTIGATTGDPDDAFNAQPGSADYVRFDPTSTSASDSGNIDLGFISQYAFAGVQTFGMSFGALQTVQATGVSGLQQSFTVSDVVGNVVVTYNYDAVPEPTSALLGGLGALALLRRRRH